VSHAGHVGLLALIFVFGASTAILHFERLPGVEHSHGRRRDLVGGGDDHHGQLRRSLSSDGRVVTATLMVPASACSHSPRRAAALRDEIASLRTSLESRAVT